jgi:hypothetical protein
LNKLYHPAAKHASAWKTSKPSGMDERKGTEEIGREDFSLARI